MEETNLMDAVQGDVYCPKCDNPKKVCKCDKDPEYSCFRMGGD